MDFPRNFVSLSNGLELRMARHPQLASGERRMVEVAEKTANFLSASKRLQILQNGSLLQFNGKILQRMVLR